MTFDVTGLIKYNELKNFLDLEFKRFILNTKFKKIKM